MVKKLSRQQKAANTRRANRQLTEWVIKEPFVISANHTALDNIGSTMTLLEQAIDGLIQRINAQTQRIKDMM